MKALLPYSFRRIAMIVSAVTMTALVAGCGTSRETTGSIAKSGNMRVDSMTQLS